MGRYFGREPRYSRQELELQAQQAIEARINMGRPPAEDFAPIEARLAELDRQQALSVPLPPLAEGHADLRVTEVRLPAAARAVRPTVGAGPTAAQEAVRAEPSPARRRAVAAKEG